MIEKCPNCDSDKINKYKDYFLCFSCRYRIPIEKYEKILEIKKENEKPKN